MSKYCEKHRYAYDGDVCPVCNDDAVGQCREIDNSGFWLLLDLVVSAASNVAGTRERHWRRDEASFTYQFTVELWDRLPFAVKKVLDHTADVTA